MTEHTPGPDAPADRTVAAPLTAWIALGANLGEPLEALRSARSRLAEIGDVVRASSLYRTVPVGGPPGQPPYLNAVLGLRPHSRYRDPRDLLDACLAIERAHGRTRRERWDARLLDLDLLDVGGEVQALEGLELPHPRMMDRAFVLAPLCEVAPTWRHPRTGEAACDALTRTGLAGVVRTDLAWSPR